MDSDDEIPEAVPLQRPSATDEDIEDQLQGLSTGYSGPVPVTLITGYLGAGKTTLVNHIVCGEHGFRIAVILNEFGEELGIEKAMMQDQDSAAFALQEVIELANGCLCCSVKNDFVQALEALLQRRSKFDYILIETTGLADPGPVAKALWTDAELESDVCLDGIVTVVDARNITNQLTTPGTDRAVNEAQQQIAYADVVLLNKVDLACEEQLQAVERRISSLNASADIVRTHRSQVALDRLLGRGGFGASPSSQPLDHGAIQGHPSQHAAHADAHKAPQTARADVHEESHTHQAGVGTVCLRVAGAVSLARLQHWLDTLLWEANAAREDVYRMKGIINVQGSERQHVLQAVHDVHDVVEGPTWPPGANRESRVVIIGRKLDEAALLGSFQSCIDS